MGYLESIWKLRPHLWPRFHRQSIMAVQNQSINPSLSKGIGLPCIFKRSSLSPLPLPRPSLHSTFSRAFPLFSCNTKRSVGVTALQQAAGSRRQAVISIRWTNPNFDRLSIQWMIMI